MASTLSARRTPPDITLQAGEPGVGPVRPAIDPTPAPALGWLLVAVVGGLAAAAAGWVLSVGMSVVGWLAAADGTLGDALTVGTRLWLLGNGVGVRLGTLPVTIIPWGATVIAAFMLSRSSSMAARQLRDGEAAGPGAVSVVTTAAYLAPVVAVAVFLGEPWLAPGRWAAVVAVLLAAAYAGGSTVMGTRWTSALPARLRAVPRAVLGAQLVLAAGGAAVLTTGLLLQLDRVTTLHDTLDAGVAGGLALLIAQLAVAPNAIVWATSYALGSGFTLGNGSLVAPSATDLGVLPGIPLFAAVPAAGPGGAGQLWWLAIGVLAGGIAAWIVVRARPAARFDETSLVGGLAGVLSGATFVAVAWATSGDLGATRLADLGPRLFPLLVMSVTTLGLAGMITGLLLGVLRTRRARRAEALRTAADAEPTAVLDREQTVHLRRRPPTADPDGEETVQLTPGERGASADPAR